MGRKYANDPIIEVVCGIQFGADSDWDLAVPGLVYEHIKGKFPKRQQARVVTFNSPSNAGTAEINTRLWYNGN